MFCIKCGFQCKEGAKFCVKCGTPLASALVMKQENKEPAILSDHENKKRHDKKEGFPVRLFLASVGALMIVLMIVFMVKKMTGRSSSRFEYLSNHRLNAIMGIFDGEKYDIVLNENGKILLDETGDSSHTKHNATQDVLTFQKDRELYVLEGSKKEKVCSDVGRYEICADGTAVAYLTDKKKGTLYLRKFHKGKPQKIADDVVGDCIVLSPDGNTVAFMQEKDKKQRMCLAVNGEEYEVLGEGEQPLAVSNHGTYLYYAQKTGELCVKTDQKVQQLSTVMGYNIFLNEDCTEVIFSESNQSYISKKGQEKIKIADQAILNFLLPDLTTRFQISSVNGNVYRIGVKQFADLVCESGEEYFYIDSMLKYQKVCSHEIDDIHISSAGDAVCYSYGGKLYRKDPLCEDGKGKQIHLGSNSCITKFEADQQLNEFYFIDENHLKFIDSTGKLTDIEEEIHEGHIFMDPADETFYYLKNEENGYGQLCYTTHGGKTTFVSDADQVTLLKLGSHLFYGIEKDGKMIYEKLSMIRNGKSYIIWK